MSRPKRKPCKYTPGEIRDLLKQGKTLKQIGAIDTGFPFPSRLQDLMIECGSDEFFMGPKTIRKRLDPSYTCDLEAGFGMVEQWGAFGRGVDSKGRRCHRRIYKEGEAEDPRSKQFKIRSRKKSDLEYTILRLFGDILKDTGCIASLSNDDIVKQTGRSLPNVIRCINSLIEKGYVVGYRQRKKKSLYVRPDDKTLINSYDMRFERIGSSASVRRSPMVNKPVGTIPTGFTRNKANEPVGRSDQQRNQDRNVSQSEQRLVYDKEGYLSDPAELEFGQTRGVVGKRGVKPVRPKERSIDDDDFFEDY